MLVCFQCLNVTSFAIVVEFIFCQSLDPRKGTQGETLEIVDESGG